MTTYDTTIEGLKRARFALDRAATAAARKAARDDLNRTVLAVFREQQGMTKYEIAGHAGIAYSTVNDIIRRERTAAPVYVGRSLDEILALAIDPEGLKGAPSYESRERNEAKPSAGKHDERCPLCSSPIKDTEAATTGAWVHMSTDWFLLPADLTEAEVALVEASGHSQGSFIVGSGCARRVPAAYKTPVTKRS